MSSSKIPPFMSWNLWKPLTSFAEVDAAISVAEGYTLGLVVLTKVVVETVA